MEHGDWDRAGLVGSFWDYRSAWQQASSVQGRNTSRTAPVLFNKPTPNVGLAGSCSKILQPGWARLSGKYRRRLQPWFRLTVSQSGVGFPTTTGLKALFLSPSSAAQAAPVKSAKL